MQLQTVQIDGRGGNFRLVDRQCNADHHKGQYEQTEELSLAGRGQYQNQGSHNKKQNGYDIIEREVETLGCKGVRIEVRGMRKARCSPGYQHQAAVAVSPVFIQVVRTPQDHHESQGVECNGREFQYAWHGREKYGRVWDIFFIYLPE